MADRLRWLWCRLTGHRWQRLLVPPPGDYYACARCGGWTWWL